MKTKGALISDVELRLSRGKPSNDFEIERSQILHWIDLSRDRLVAQKLNSQILSNEMIDPFYIEKIGSYSAVLEEPVVVACTERYTFTIDSEILVLFEDRGVDRIVTNGGLILNKSTFDDIEYLKDLWFSRPTNENMMWYREGSKFFIYGASSNTVKKIKFNVFGVKSNVGSSLTDDDIYPVGDDLISDVVNLSEEIGMRELYGQMEDRANDGNQPPKQVS